jgi:glutamine amidotransferase
VIAIVDCGIGNTGSISNMLRKSGIDHLVTSDPGEIERAQKLILPGVGSFDHGMRRLQTLGLVGPLEEKVLGQRVPILGICLGMQLFSERSQEGQEPGLGWLQAETVRVRFENDDARLKVPHMGWNTVQRTPSAAGFCTLNADARFYFVHSYHVACRNPEDVLTTTRYGCEFASAVRHENVVGVQFHPEKSHRYGLAFLNEFATS